MFRFPHRAGYVDLLDTERRLHALVAGVLPSPVAVPRIDLVGQPSAAFPYRFAGHRFMPGTAADAIEPSLLPVTARTLGAALGAIHAIPEDAVRAAGIDEMSGDDPARRQWLNRGVAAAAALRGIDAVVDRAREWLGQQHLLSLPPPPGPRSLVHTDLTPDHLLADPATGGLIGILDWTDAILDDPARDFVPLVASCGWAFADEVLRGYPGRVDPAFRQRLRFMARLLSLIWLVMAREEGADVAEHVRWVHNAFAAEDDSRVGDENISGGVDVER